MFLQSTDTLGEMETVLLYLLNFFTFRKVDASNDENKIYSFA